MVNILQKIYSQPLIQSFYAECKYILWPFTCASCKLFLRTDTLLCGSCIRTITPVVSVPVLLTAKVTMQVYAIASYKEVIKRLILAKGWHDERASIVLGRLLWHNSTLPHIPFDVIVPIPLHWRRFASRGYNQAELIAQELSVLSGKPVCLALKRKKVTAFQSTLSAQARRDNVKESFVLSESARAQIKAKRVLIVDDLITSGATLQAAGKLINQCKPEDIKAAVAGRVL